MTKPSTESFSWFCEACQNRFLGLAEDGKPPRCNLCQSNESVKPCVRSSAPCPEKRFVDMGKPDIPKTLRPISSRERAERLNARR